ncbi:MAG: GNAT family N-acetyltransferase [Deltaproteobacteria bacterium]
MDLKHKRNAVIFGPMGPGLLRRPDTQVIERPGWYQLVTPSAPGGVLNEIAYSQVEDGERCIDEALATYGAHGLTFKWRVGPWTRPEDLATRLKRRGFDAFEMRGMVTSTSHPIEVPADVEIVTVDRECLDEYVRVFTAGWGLPRDQEAPLVADHVAAMEAEDRVGHFFAARIDGAIVATTALVVRDGFGYLMGAQVLDAFRGRGVYRALIAARLRFLAEHGLTLAATQAREATSAPMLEHLGFETVLESQVFQIDAT